VHAPEYGILGYPDYSLTLCRLLVFLNVLHSHEGIIGISSNLKEEKLRYCLRFYNENEIHFPFEPKLWSKLPFCKGFLKISLFKTNHQSDCKLEF
jgi:hypothetical protein